MLGTIGSLVYSALFPYTVAVGGSRVSASRSTFTAFCFSISCTTVALFFFNPSFGDICPWTPLVMIVDPKSYMPILLYLTLFGAISHTASTSFNFEEVSLISQAVAHVLNYVSSVTPHSLSFHEIFLPGLTVGLMLSISPARPFLRRIKSSKSPIWPLLAGGVITTGSIVFGIRPLILGALGEDPIIWVLNYMLASEGYQIRLLIVAWWLGVLAFGIFVPVTFFTGSEKEDNGEALNKRRKFFHGIVVLLFIPSLNLDVFP